MGAKLEKEIERECLAYLVRSGWWPWKNPTLGVYDVKASSFRTNSNPFALNGTSDIIAIRSGVVLFIEVKTPKGKQSKAQKLFEKCITERGGHYFLVRSRQELEEILDGLQTQWQATRDKLA